MEHSVPQKKLTQSTSKYFDFNQENENTTKTSIVTQRSSQILISLHISVFIIVFGFTTIFFIINNFTFVPFVVFSLFSLLLLSLSFIAAIKEKIELSAILFAFETFISLEAYILVFHVVIFDILYYGFLPTIFLVYFVRDKISFGIISLHGIILVVLMIYEGFSLIEIIAYPGLFMLLSTSVLFLISKYQHRTEELYYDTSKENELLRLEIENQLETDNLTARIAHDFNNILSSIGISSELIQLYHSSKDTNHGKELQDLIKTIQKSVESGNELVNSLFKYQKLQNEIQTFNLINHTEEILPILKSILNKSVSLIWEHTEETIILKFNRSELDQILINLIKNANEAIEDHGIIFLRMYTKLIEKRNYIVIEVEDTGEGMREEVIERVFSERFTTKAYGNGIGLNSVKEIMKRHEGKLQLTSAIGKGTKFKLIFPE